MSRIRKLLIMSGATAALSVATLGAIPAAAADTQGTLAIVNGVPGRRLDVCVNGTEIKSGLRYGKAVFRSVISTGEKILKLYDPDPRTCKGHLRAEHDGFNLASRRRHHRGRDEEWAREGRPLRQRRPWRGSRRPGAPMATSPLGSCSAMPRRSSRTSSSASGPRSQRRRSTPPPTRSRAKASHYETLSWHRLHLAAPRHPSGGS